MNAAKDLLKKIQSKFFELSLRERVLVTAVGVGIVGYLAYTYVLIPGDSKNTQLLAEEVSIQRSIEEFQRKINAVRNASPESVKESLSRLKAMEDSSFNSANDLVKVLIDKSSMLKTSVTTLTYTDPKKVDGSTLKTVNIKMELLGSYFHLVEFIYALRKMPVIAEISKMTLIPSEYDEELILSLDITLYFFMK